MINLAVAVLQWMTWQLPLNRVVEETSSKSKLGVTSVRKVAEEVGIISKTSVHKILRDELKLYPCKLQVVQALEPADKRKRCELASWLLDNQNVIDDIVWSDEAYFSLNGIVNTHNCRIWSDVKPSTCISKSLHSASSILFGDWLQWLIAMAIISNTWFEHFNHQILASYCQIREFPFMLRNITWLVIKKFIAFLCRYSI